MYACTLYDCVFLCFRYLSGGIFESMVHPLLNMCHYLILVHYWAAQIIHLQILNRM